jgi:PIN domain nuclease of toxin-antitoxin system
VDSRNAVFVSAANIWEIEIKRRLGKLASPVGLVEASREAGFTLLDIRAQHAVAAARLPRHHTDPFDRMLVAQAMIEDCVLVTRDRKLARYDVPTLTA